MPAESTPSGLDAFRRRVLRDPDLQARLLAEPDPARFPAAAVEAAARVGVELSVEEVVAAWQAANQERAGQWI